MASDILFGFGCGIAVMLVVSTWFAKREHEAWMKLCDRYKAVIDQLQRERDAADAWKWN